MSNKYADIKVLQTFLDNLKNLFATKTVVDNKADINHAHSYNELEDRTHWEENGEIHQLDEKFIPDSVKAKSDWAVNSVETTVLILSSPNGTRFKITIGDDGILTASEITE